MVREKLAIYYIRYMHKISRDKWIVIANQLQTTYGGGLAKSKWICIAVNAASVWMHAMKIDSKLIRIVFVVWTALKDFLIKHRLDVIFLCLHNNT